MKSLLSSRIRITSSWPLRQIYSQTPFGYTFLPSYSLFENRHPTWAPPPSRVCEFPYVLRGIVYSRSRFAVLVGITVFYLYFGIMVFRGVFLQIFYILRKLPNRLFVFLKHRNVPRAGSIDLMSNSGSKPLLYVVSNQINHYYVWWQVYWPDPCTTFRYFF